MESVHDQFVIRKIDKDGRPIGSVSINWEAQNKWTEVDQNKVPVWLEVESANECRHCKTIHEIKCSCTHGHNEHLFGGGCRIKKCLCDRYDGFLSTRVEVIKKTVELPGIDVSKLEEQTKAVPVLADAQKRLDNLKRIKEKVLASKNSQED